MGTFKNKTEIFDFKSKIFDLESKIFDLDAKVFAIKIEINSNYTTLDNDIIEEMRIYRNTLKRKIYNLKKNLVRSKKLNKINEIKH